MAKTITKAGDECDSYLELVKQVPLKTIRSEDRYQPALSMMNKLMVRGEDNLDGGEMEYLEVLIRMVKDYEDQNHRADLSDLTPTQVLRHLMEVHGMKIADLGRLIGSPSSASMILNGKRGISKSQAKKLSERFSVGTDLFL